MGSFVPHFYDDVVIVERIEQEIRASRISEPIEKWFIMRKNDAEVSNVKEGYKSKKNYQTQSYQTMSS
jgi:hypothetical protein